MGLVYFGKRYLNTALQRWVSADPLQIHKGGTDPNLYAYVSGRALRNIDPLGLEAIASAADEAGNPVVLHDDGTQQSPYPEVVDAAAEVGESDAGRTETKTIEEEIHERTLESDKVAHAVVAEIWNRTIDDVGQADSGGVTGGPAAAHAAAGGLVQGLKVDVPDCDGCEIAPEVAGWALLGAAVLSVLSLDPKKLDDVLSGGKQRNVAYRALREGENPAEGLRARAPGAGTEVGSHVMGKKESSQISLSKSEEIVREKFDSGNGIVEVDLDQVDPALVQDVSSGTGKGRVFTRTRGHQEVLVNDPGGAEAPIPPSAVKSLD